MANINEAYNTNFGKSSKKVNMYDVENENKKYKCNCGGIYSFLSKKYKSDQTYNFDLIYRCSICRSFRILETY
jgi:predicted SprT family Zn-dependent metalloprotease